MNIILFVSPLASEETYNWLLLAILLMKKGAVRFYLCSDDTIFICPPSVELGGQMNVMRLQTLCYTFDIFKNFRFTLFFLRR